MLYDFIYYSYFMLTPDGRFYAHLSEAFESNKFLIFNFKNLSAYISLVVKKLNIFYLFYRNNE